MPECQNETKKAETLDGSCIRKSELTAIYAICFGLIAGMIATSIYTCVFLQHGFDAGENIIFWNVMTFFIPIVFSGVGLFAWEFHKTQNKDIDQTGTGMLSIFSGVIGVIVTFLSLIGNVAIFLTILILIAVVIVIQKMAILDRREDMFNRKLFTFAFWSAFLFISLPIAIFGTKAENLDQVIWDQERLLKAEMADGILTLPLYQESDKEIYERFYYLTCVGITETTMEGKPKSKLTEFEIEDLHMEYEKNQDIVNGEEQRTISSLYITLPDEFPTTATITLHADRSWHDSNRVFKSVRTKKPKRRFR